MSGKSIKDFDDDELVSEAGSGMPTKRDHAQAELTRRLIQALSESKQSTEIYNKLLFYLTTLLFVVGLAQLIFTSLTLPGVSLWPRVIGTVSLAAMILYIAYRAAKEIFLNKVM